MLKEQKKSWPKLPSRSLQDRPDSKDKDQVKVPSMATPPPQSPISSNSVSRRSDKFEGHSSPWSLEDSVKGKKQTAPHSKAKGAVWFYESGSDESEVVNHPDQRTLDHIQDPLGSLVKERKRKSRHRHRDSSFSSNSGPSPAKRHKGPTGNSALRPNIIPHREKAKLRFAPSDTRRNTGTQRLVGLSASERNDIDSVMNNAPSTKVEMKFIDDQRHGGRTSKGQPATSSRLPGKPSWLKTAFADEKHAKGIKTWTAAHPPTERSPLQRKRAGTLDMQALCASKKKERDFLQSEKDRKTKQMMKNMKVVEISYEAKLDRIKEEILDLEFQLRRFRMN